MLSDKAQRGVETITDMLGAKKAEALKDHALSGRFGARMAQLGLENCYADSWDEDGLSRREKSLMLIATLIALRQPNELRNHVRLGLANGVGIDELEKILVHLVPYVGFPATSTAGAAMRAVIEEETAKAGG